MSETREQVRPLAPASSRRTTSVEEAATTVTNYTRRRQCLRCCACACPFFLLHIVVMVILIFTVFKPKDPVFRLNRLTVARLDLINGTTRPRPGSNMTLIVDMSVKNKNYVSFRYPNSTASVFYRGAEVAVARVPAGLSKARRTLRLNATVAVILDRLLSQPELWSDLNSSLVRVSFYSKVSGKAKVWIIKKHVRVRLNCSMAFNVTSQALDQQKCKHKFKL